MVGYTVTSLDYDTCTSFFDAALIDFAKFRIVASNKDYFDYIVDDIIPVYVDFGVIQEELEKGDDMDINLILGNFYHSSLLVAYYVSLLFMNLSAFFIILSYFYWGI